MPVMLLLKLQSYFKKEIVQSLKVQELMTMLPKVIKEVTLQVKYRDV